MRERLVRLRHDGLELPGRGGAARWRGVLQGPAPARQPDRQREREDPGGASNDDTRIQFSVKYNFGTKL